METGEGGGEAGDRTWDPWVKGQRLIYYTITTPFKLLVLCVYTASSSSFHYLYLIKCVKFLTKLEHLYFFNLVHPHYTNTIKISVFLLTFVTFCGLEDTTT